METLIHDQKWNRISDEQLLNEAITRLWSRKNEVNYFPNEVNTILTGNEYEKVIIWPRTGIWKDISNILYENGISFTPVWSRNEWTIQEISKWANPDKEGYSWDVFKPETEANKYIIESLPNKKSIIYLSAGMDMDPYRMLDPNINPNTFAEWDGWIDDIQKEAIRWKAILGAGDEWYKKFKNIIVKDIINPETWQKWHDWTTITEKNELRKRLADNQIEFIRHFIQSLLNRNSREPIVIIFFNTIMAKAFESPMVGDVSHYARFKNEVTKIIEDNRLELEKKWVYIKNIILGLVYSPMLLSRWPVSLIMSKEAADRVWMDIPIGGKPLVARIPLESLNVAENIIKIANTPPDMTPNLIPYFLEEHWNIKNITIEYEQWGDKILKKVISEREKLWITKDQILENKEINITEAVKDFLIELRQESLDIYISQLSLSKEKKEKLKRKLAKNLEVAREIIKKLPQKIFFKSFIDNVCLRIEWNYP